MWYVALPFTALPTTQPLPGLGVFIFGIGIEF
jgi:hypothetical protein